MPVEKDTNKLAKMSLEADGNVVGDSFIIQPDKTLTAKLGVIFGVIEIYHVNDAFLDGFLSAVNDLKTEYYLPPFNLERGVEKRFEEAISRANRRIYSAVNQSIEEIDLRNVSAAIGLFHDNKIYLSSAGRIKGLFYRRKKNDELLIIDILSGNGEARFRPEPEKIFANILSGELAKRDALLLINEEFLGVFSQKELGETVLANSAVDAIRLIDDSLREKIAKKNFYAVAVSANGEAVAEAPLVAKNELPISSNVSTRPFRDNPALATTVGHIAGRVALDAQPPRTARPGVPTQQSIDRLLITQVRTEKYLTPSLLPQWQKILVITLATGKKYFFYLLRQSKKLAIFTAKKISELKNRAPKTKPAETIRPSTNPLIVASQYQELISNREIPIEEMPADASQAMEFNQDDGPVEPIYSVNFESPEVTTKQPEILIEELEVAVKTPENGWTGKINKLLNAQIEKFLDLKKIQQIVFVAGLILLFIFSQSVVVIGRASDTAGNGSTITDDLATQIEKQLINAEAQNIFNDEAGALQSIKKARELLAEIPDKRSTKTLKSDWQAKIDEMARKLQKIVLLDNPAVAADFQTGGTQAGLAKTGASFWSYDNAGKAINRLDTASGKITLATTSLSGIARLTAMDDKNLILMGEGKIYYKYNIAEKTAVKFKPAKDYFQIKLPAIASPLIDPSLASSTIAMSATSETYSFFLDGVNGRVTIIDKNGILKRQYYSEKFQGAGALALAVKDKKIWVFADGKAYQVDLDF